MLWTFLAMANFAGAQDVILHLKNGDRVTGSIVSTNAQGVVVATPYAGRVTISAAQIARREVQAARAASQPLKPVPTLASPPPAQKSSVPGKAAPTAQAPPKPVATDSKSSASKPKETRPTLGASLLKFLSGWKGELEVGLNLAFSTIDRQAYAGRVRATHLRTMPNQRLLKNDLDYLASYGRTDGVLSDNRMDGSWKLEYDIGKQFLAYNAVGTGYDEVRSIDLRYDVGPGLGYKWITRTNFVLRTELGGNYQQQMFAGDGTKHSYSLRLGEESWRQVTGKLRLDEKVEFFPSVDKFGEYRLRGEVNLSYLVRNNVALKLTLIDLYETDPPINISNNDLQIRSSVGIKF
jgi:putative salt-induced outer membrane protein YdiY